MAEIKDITHLTSEIVESFRYVRDDIEEKFRDNEDINYGRFLIECLDKLDQLEKALAKIQDQYDSVREEVGFSEPLSSKKKEDGLRVLRLNISENAIKQSLLSLTAAKKLGLVTVGERMTIHTPEGKPFTTIISTVGNRLEERGRIRAFFKEHNVDEEDIIILEEIEPKVWKLYVDEARRELEAKIWKEIEGTI
jgi:hypothetical protein